MRLAGVTTTVAACAALAAEVVALAVRPLTGDSPLGPAAPTLLVILGTAGILALRRRRGIGGTLATAGAVAAAALAYGGVPVLVPALLTWIAALVAAAGRAQLGAPPARLRLAGAAATPTPARVVAWPVLVTVGVTVVAIALLQLLNGQSGQGGTGAGGRGGGGDADSPRLLATYAGGELDLAARGPLADTPVFDVPASSPQLWRTGSLGTYTGRTWEPLPEDSPLLRVGVGRAAFGPGVPPPLDGLRFDDGDGPDARGRALASDLRFVGTSLSWLPVTAPGRLRGVDAGDGVAVVQSGRRALLLVDAAEAGIASDDVELEELDPSVLQSPASVGGYRVSWAPRPDVHDPGLRAAAETGDDLDEGRSWTQLPESVPQRVRDLAVRLTRDAGDRLEAARTVEAYVNRTAEYTLEGPPLPDGADAADDLLFGSRQGFCEQFATAEAVLLRAVGVPARVATGWAGGDVTGDRRLVRALNAHAWVEVLVPGLGWVSSDPTAGAREAPPPADALSLLRDWRFWLAVGLLAALVVGVVLLVRRRRRRPLPRPVPVLPSERLLAAYELAQEALGRAGLAREPTQTLAEHAESVLTLVRSAGGPPTDADVESALAAVAQALYGSAPPPDAASEQAAATLRELAAAVPRLVEDARTALTTP